MLFGCATLNEAALYEELIKRHYATLDGSVNLNKLSLIFSNNISPILRSSISKLLRIQNNWILQKYLGVWIEFQTKCNANLKGLKEKIFFLGHQVRKQSC